MCVIEGLALCKSVLNIGKRYALCKPYHNETVTDIIILIN